ncbi:MAG: helix-turn-helix transcriptional regulator [Ilumatobacteraceae bacterium]
MARTTIDELKKNRLAAMTADERAVFDETYEATRLALDVGEKVRDAREAAGLSQRELASRMGTSQAAVARLEAGGVGATLTTLQKVAAALDLKITVELSAAS